VLGRLLFVQSYRRGAGRGLSSRCYRGPESPCTFESLDTILSR
jgi:hypothetical protein